MKSDKFSLKNNSEYLAFLQQLAVSIEENLQEAYRQNLQYIEIKNPTKTPKGTLDV